MASNFLIATESIDCPTHLKEEDAAKSQSCRQQDPRCQSLQQMTDRTARVQSHITRKMLRIHIKMMNSTEALLILDEEIPNQTGIRSQRGFVEDLSSYPSKENATDVHL